jgi:hypothetical protein
LLTLFRVHDVIIFARFPNKIQQKDDNPEERQQMMTMAMIDNQPEIDDEHGQQYYSSLDDASLW